MSETTVPGIKAKHAIITPNCRQVQGGEYEAFREACNRLAGEYASILNARADRDEIDFHLVLTVAPCGGDR